MCAQYPDNRHIIYQNSEWTVEERVCPQCGKPFVEIIFADRSKNSEQVQRFHEVGTCRMCFGR